MIGWLKRLFTAKPQEPFSEFKVGDHVEVYVPHGFKGVGVIVEKSDLPDTWVVDYGGNVPWPFSAKYITPYEEPGFDGPPEWWDGSLTKRIE